MAGKLRTRYRAVRNVFLPTGSRRREAYNSLAIAVKRFLGLYPRSSAKAAAGRWLVEQGNTQKRVRGVGPALLATMRRWREAVRMISWRLLEALHPRGLGGYGNWVLAFDTLTGRDRDQIRARASELPEAMSLAVVLLLDERDQRREILACVNSVESQLLDRWVGIVVGPRSVVESGSLEGIFRARPRWNRSPGDLEAALARVEQALVVFVRPGDVLAEQALYVLADAAMRHPQAVVLYPDEDRLVGGLRVAPHFKPGWSPYRVWCQDYVGHRLACRREFIGQALGRGPLGAEPGLPLVLLASQTRSEVLHVPFVLYHARRERPRAMAAALHVLEQHLRQVAPGARVEAGKLPDTFRVRLPVPSAAPLVTIIIPTRNRGDLLRACVESLRQTTDYPAYEILVVDNGSDEEETRRYLAELERAGVARVLPYPGPFNFAAINNTAAKEARGELLAFLNNDIEVHDPGWLREMASWALRPDVGAVGCRLRYRDGTVQHGGVAVGMGGVAAHEHARLRENARGHGGAAWTVREAGAVTAACLVLRRQVFEEVQGFDEALRVAFNDVDLCLRIRRNGRAVLYTPFVDLYHLESASRGSDARPENLARLRLEIDLMRERHGSSLWSDPFFSPNLSLRLSTAAPAFPPRVARPWLLAGAKRPRIAFLTHHLLKGYGVEVVVAEQVEYFCARGFDVFLMVLEKDRYYESRLGSYVASGRLQVITVESLEEAAHRVAFHGIDIAVAHTPPFHEGLAILPATCLRVLFDHGEPPAQLFEDAEERLRIAGRKVAVSRRVDLSVAISSFIQADSGLHRPERCFNGNDHLLRRRSNLAGLAGRFRERLRLGDAFVVLNVTRYLNGERLYKGVEQYAEVRDALLKAHPELKDVVRFVLAGRGEPEDQAWAEERGLVASSNLDDDNLMAAYLDSDLYLSTSQWEGYNLGLAQALALGVPSLASARGAHPEFPIETSNDAAVLAERVRAEVTRRQQRDGQHGPRAPLRRLRQAVIFPWKDAAQRLELLLRQRARGSGESLFPMPSVAEAVASDPPALSFLILSKDRPDLLIPCIRSIEEHCDVSYEILIGDTGSTDPGTLDLYESTRHAVHYLGFYNFSVGNNILAARARGRHLLFLNNDTKLIRTDFREALGYLRAHPDVACLGGYLVYADGRIQHAGVRICPEAPYRGIPEHFDRFEPFDGYPGLSGPREVLAVTGAMLLIDAQLFGGAEGFDEVYQEEAQDIDLCLRLRARGMRSIVHPALRAFHYENSTRTIREAPGDRAEFLRRYRRLFEVSVYEWQSRIGLS